MKDYGLFICHKGLHCIRTRESGKRYIQLVSDFVLLGPFSNKVSKRSLCSCSLQVGSPRRKFARRLFTCLCLISVRDSLFSFFFFYIYVFRNWRGEGLERGMITNHDSDLGLRLPRSRATLCKNVLQECYYLGQRTKIAANDPMFISLVYARER
jgi:hypothetical protein